MMKKIGLIILLIVCSCKPIEKKVSESTTTIDSLTQKPLLTNEQFDSIYNIRYERALAYEDSVMKVMQWKPLKDGLSISRFGDVGFKTSYVIGAPNFVDTYRTSFCCEDGKPFKEIIDVDTFQQIGGDWGWGGYFRDKNHIYHFWGNSGGGEFYIVDEADLATFEIVSDCYARDKNYVYHMRFGIMERIDPKEFKILKHNEQCYGKYKDSYYNGNDLLSPEELVDPEMQEAIQLLDKL